MKKSTGKTMVAGFGALIGAAAVLAMTAAGHAGMLDGLWKKSPSAAAKAAGVTETPDAVRIPLKALDSGKALFLSMETNGAQLHYFVLRDGNGKYRAALDACDVCFRANRGYRQEGDRMVCVNCGQTFPSDRIGERKGGCNPHPLAHREESGSMVVAKSDLEAGARYFPGKRK